MSAGAGARCAANRMPGVPLQMIRERHIFKSFDDEFGPLLFACHRCWFRFRVLGLGFKTCPIEPRFVHDKKRGLRGRTQLERHAHERNTHATTTTHAHTHSQKRQYKHRHVHTNTGMYANTNTGMYARSHALQTHTHKLNIQAYWSGYAAAIAAAILCASASSGPRLGVPATQMRILFSGTGPEPGQGAVA